MILRPGGCVTGQRRSDRPRRGQALPLVFLVTLGSCADTSGLTGIGNWLGENLGLVRRDAEQVKVQSFAPPRSAFRTADGHLIVEVSRDDVSWDETSGRVELAPGVRATLQRIGDGNAHVGLLRETTVDDYLMTIDRWASAEVQKLANADVTIVSGETIREYIARGASHRFGIDATADLQRLDIEDVPGRRLTGIAAPYRLLIGIYLDVAGVSLIAASVGVTVTGAVVVAPPLFIAGTALVGLGTTMILSVVYTEQQRALFERDLQRIKTILKRHGARNPPPDAFRLALFDPNGFGYASGLTLPDRVNRVFPLGNDAMLCEDTTGTLHLIELAGPRIRKVRCGSDRLSWALMVGGNLCLGFDSNEIEVIDVGSLEQTVRFRIPADAGGARAVIRAVVGEYILIQNQSNRTHLIDPRSGTSRPIVELNRRIRRVTAWANGTVVLELGERDAVEWSPQRGILARARNLETSTGVVGSRVRPAAAPARGASLWDGPRGSR